MKITPKTGLIAVLFLTITILMATSTLAAITITGNYTGGCTSEIAYDDNYIYCGNNSDLLKIDKTTLTLDDSYSYTGGSDFGGRSKPVISGDYIFINVVDDNAILRINKNTMSLTHSYTASDMAFPPIVYDNYVYFLTANRYVYQLSESSLSYVNRLAVSSGYVESTSSYPTIIQPDPINAPGAYILFAGGSALALPDSMGPGSPLTILISYSGISGWVNTIPIFLNNYTYLGASSGWIYKFDWNTGALNASIRMSGGVDTLLTDGTSIFAADGNTIRKYDQTLTQQNSTTITSEFPLFAPSGNIIASIWSGTTYEIDPDDLSTISSIPIGKWIRPTLENETIYIPGETLYVAGVGSCTSLWVCDGYAACDVDDEQKCNSVNDTNSCGESYTGDYTEFTPLTCDYCTPNWTCKTYEQCISPATTVDCNSVTDENSCSEPYTGNYSEFTPNTCTYRGGGGGIPADDDDDDDDQGEDNNNQGEESAPLLSIGGLSTKLDVNKQTIKDILTILAGGILLLVIYYITKPKGKKKRKKR